MANICAGMSIRTRLLVSVAVILSLSQFTACRHAIPNSPTSSQTPKASPNPSATPNLPSYSCYRHVYNNTGCPWTFQANADHGNVWFINDSNCAINCNSENGPCTVPTGCAISIQYTTTGGGIVGGWVATDWKGASRGWSYSSPYPASQCPYISHSGNTGAINLNDPANGDITAGGCTW